MRRYVIAVFAAACGWLVGMTAIHAADTWPIPDLSVATHAQAIADAFKQRPVDVVVLLGAGPDGMILKPGALKLKKGVYYRLIVMNPSSITHNFWIPSFSNDVIASRQISVTRGIVRTVPMGSADTRYATVDIKIESFAVAVWKFVARKDGRYSFGCSSLDHTVKGMKGEIVIG